MKRTFIISLSSKLGERKFPIQLTHVKNKLDNIVYTKFNFVTGEYSLDVDMGRRKKKKQHRSGRSYSRSDVQSYSRSDVQSYSRSDVQSYSRDDIQKKGKSDTVKTVVIYNELFAISQVALYERSCVICHTTGYFMETCNKCHVVQCCSHKCLCKHRSKHFKTSACALVAEFQKARQSIPQELKEKIFHEGNKEISHHLYSVPRREIFEMMHGSRSVLLLKILHFTNVNNLFYATVQDFNGLCTKVIFHALQDQITVFLLPFWMMAIEVMFPPNSFILLCNCHWNNHLDKTAAAINIFDLNNVHGLSNY